MKINKKNQTPNLDNFLFCKAVLSILFRAIFFILLDIDVITNTTLRKVPSGRYQCFLLSYFTFEWIASVFYASFEIVNTFNILIFLKKNKKQTYWIHNYWLGMFIYCFSLWRKINVFVTFKKCDGTLNRSLKTMIKISL